MNQPLDLDTVRLKMANELNDKEKDFIREKREELTDEDKEAYSNILANGESSSEGDEEETTTSETVTTPAEGEESGGGTPAEPAKEPETQSSEPPKYTFQTEEEAKRFVQQQLEENEKAKQAAIDAAATPAEKKYVEDNWKPADWNEGIKTAAEAAADLVEERQKERAKAIQKQNEKIEAEWQALAKENNLKPISTKEGLAVHNAIVDIGVKHGKKNFKDAYELYMMIPTDKGGGYVVPAANPDPAVDEEAKKKEDARKAAAAKLGGQNPGAGSTKGAASIKPLSYEDLKKPTSKLIKEAFHG